jgi:hypothetical protein
MVSVLVLHEDDGGRSRGIDPMDCTEPRFTVIVCG